jgi:enamine deaminase RidA (YjgF/YER057c/UK114 family)
VEKSIEDFYPLTYPFIDKIRPSGQPIDHQEDIHMTDHVQYLQPPGMHHNPAFSQVIVVESGARTIYIGGQNAVNAAGEIVGKGDLAAQTEQIFDNLEAALAAAGAKLENVIQWRMFIVQGQDLRPGFGVFQRRWGNRGKPPLVTMAFVSGLANPDFLVEIEATAVI